MKSTKAPVFPSFEEVKQNLDPASSYLVFERAKVRREGQEFSEIVEVLSGFKHRKLEWHICLDALMKKALLVVKVESGQEEAIMEEILDTGLRKDLLYSIYRSHPSI